MRLTTKLLASVAMIAVSATAVAAAEMPHQPSNGLNLGKLSTSAAQLPAETQRPKAQKAVKVAQRRRRRARRSRRRGRRGGAVAGAIALGVAALLAAEAARAGEDRHYGRRCRRWARLCDRGRDWACDKFDYRC